HHHVVHALVGDAVVVDPQAVVVVETRGALRFSHEALDAALGRGTVGAQHLDGDVSLELDLVRAVHDAHTALAEVRLDAVAAREGLADQRARGRVGAGRTATLRRRRRGGRPRLGLARIRNVGARGRGRGWLFGCVRGSVAP